MLSKVRVITAIAMVIILIPFILLGGYFMYGLCAVLAFIGTYELVKMHNNKYNLPTDVLETINKIEDLTKELTNYTLGICFNYGGRQEIVHAAKEICKKVVDGKLSIDDINVELFDEHLYTAGIDPVDLMIRTSG